MECFQPSSAVFGNVTLPCLERLTYWETQHNFTEFHFIWQRSIEPTWRVSLVRVVLSYLHVVFATWPVTAKKQELRKIKNCIQCASQTYHFLLRSSQVRH